MRAARQIFGAARQERAAVVKEAGSGAAGRGAARQNPAAR